MAGPWKCPALLYEILEGKVRNEGKQAQVLQFPVLEDSEVALRAEGRRLLLSIPAGRLVGALRYLRSLDLAEEDEVAGSSRNA